MGAATIDATIVRRDARFRSESAAAATTTEVRGLEVTAAALGARAEARREDTLAMTMVDATMEDAAMMPIVETLARSGVGGNYGQTAARSYPSIRGNLRRAMRTRTLRYAQCGRCVRVWGGSEGRPREGAIAERACR